MSAEPTDKIEWRVKSGEWRYCVGKADDIVSPERGAMSAFYALNECAFASLPQSAALTAQPKAEP